jgi:DNA-binding response OmpR family regulator
MALSEAAPMTVLVVDDEEGIRLLLTEALRQAGFRVLTAPNGENVPEICRKEDIRLVITDLVMPEREGLETIQALRREFPRMRIVAISGKFLGTGLRAAQILGADEAIAKPFEPEAVVSIARRLLGQGAQRECQPRYD